MPKMAVYGQTGKMISWALSFGALGLGLVFLLGKDERFSSPSFAGLIHVWGGKDFWGGLWLGVGLALLIFRDRLALAAAYFTGAVVSLFFALFFINAAWNDPRASLTGIVAYGALGWVYVSYATAEYVLRKLGRDERN